jgi:uncharacterized protein YndB with AHSA1/START domain
MSKETKTIRQTELIPAEPIDVYEALMDAKTHTEFTGPKATSIQKSKAKHSLEGIHFREESQA